MEPIERLKSWIEAAAISNAEMARRCGYDRANFHRVLAGKVPISVPLALAIERETGGTIAAGILNANVALSRQAAA